jgi:hypothetical protein
MFKKKKIETPVEEVVTEEVVIAEDTVFEEEHPLVVGEVAPEPEVERGAVYYNGSKVVEKLEGVNGDGHLCRLEDGTTAYVPLAVLGESTDA